MSRKRVLVLGLGNFGRSWALDIVPFCREKAELAGVVDTREETHKAFLGATDCFADLEEALDAVKPDLVINATTPERHLETTLQILEHKIPVLCEKPIAANLEEAEQMAARAAEQKAFVMIGENYRYGAVFRKCREILQEGRLGKLHMMECRFRHYHPESGKTYHGKLAHPLLTDVSVHHLDLARYLSGEEPVWVEAREWKAPYCWYQERPANASVFSQMTNDVAFSYVGTLGAPVSETDWPGNWSLECDRGILQIQDGRLYELAEEGRREIPVPPDIYADTRAAMLLEAIAALEEGREGESRILENLKTFRWLQAAIASAELQNRVTLDEKDENKITLGEKDAAPQNPGSAEPLIRNFLSMPLKQECIHGGEGLCAHATVFSENDFEAPVRFLNYTVVPKGGSFGLHKHGRDNEIYILLEGEGSYEADGVRRPVKTGDIMVNAPFAAHSIRNEGETEMRLLVLEAYF